MDSSQVTPDEDPETGFSVIVDSQHQPPIPAIMVADQRDRLGKRLAFVGIGLLILFFTVSGYIQSARNGHDLAIATKDRSQQAITAAEQAKLLAAKDRFEQALETIIARQATALAKAGLQNQILVQPSAPPAPSKPTRTTSPAPRPRQAPAPSQPPRKPPKPTHKPSPAPSSTCLLPSPAPCIHRLDE